MEAFQAGRLPYNPAEHGGLEPNPLADGGSAPEVVAAPVDYYASPEKDASGQYPPQQYAQQPAQWAHEPMLPKYPGTPADAGYAVDHSNQAGAYDYAAAPAQYQGDDAYHPPIAAGAPVVEEENPGPRWCGMPRKRAMILMIVAVLIVIAVAVGVGVGVGDKKSSPSTVAYVFLPRYPLPLGLLHLLLPLLLFCFVISILFLSLFYSSSHVSARAFCSSPGQGSTGLMRNAELLLHPHQHHHHPPTPLAQQTQRFPARRPTT